MGDDSGAMEPRAVFESTLWSVVLQAREGNAAQRRAALQRLCQIYWPPLYSYLRRKGHSHEQAQDLVQGFFTYLLEKALMDRADPERGRFRSYLLTILENWLAGEHRKSRAQKRGGGQPTLSFDFTVAGSIERVEPEVKESPEDSFNRSWALTVLKQALELLKDEYESRGMGAHYEAFCAHISGGADRPSHEALSTALGCTLGDVNSLLSASRRRLRELVRSVLRQTVADESDVDQEVSGLFRILLKK
jgi:RNA polymerase sigma factor (sigma-70 family)